MTAYDDRAQRARTDQAFRNRVMMAVLHKTRTITLASPKPEQYLARLVVSTPTAQAEELVSRVGLAILSNAACNPDDDASVQTEVDAVWPLFALTMAPAEFGGLPTPIPAVTP
jgi:hypothetical protein